MKLRRKRVKPIGIDDVTIIDDTRLRKAITAASLGNAMEWFDFGVYGFVAYALGKVFFPDVSPGVQMIAALATFCSFPDSPVGWTVLRYAGRQIWSSENPLHHHHHHVGQYLLYRPDTVLRLHRHLGTYSAAVSEDGSGLLGGR